MKKLVLMFVAIAAISFASCGGNNAAPEATDEAEDSVVVDSVSADSVQADSVEAPAEEAAE